MQRCSIVRLAELTGERIRALIDLYRRTRGLKTLWRERAWGEVDERARHAIEHNDETALQLLIVRNDVTDTYLGDVAHPATAWQLYYLLEGADPLRYARQGFRQPDFIPHSGEHWVSIWGEVYRSNPYDAPTDEKRVITSEASSEAFALRDWLTATIRTTATQGTGETQSRDYDRGMIHGLTLALNHLTEDMHEGP